MAFLPGVLVSVQEIMKEENINVRTEVGLDPFFFTS